MQLSHQLPTRHLASADLDGTAAGPSSPPPVGITDFRSIQDLTSDRPTNPKAFDTRFIAPAEVNPRQPEVDLEASPDLESSLALTLPLPLAPDAATQKNAAQDHSSEGPAPLLTPIIPLAQPLPQPSVKQAPPSNKPLPNPEPSVPPLVQRHHPESSFPIPEAALTVTADGLGQEISSAIEGGNQLEVPSGVEASVPESSPKPSPIPLATTSTESSTQSISDPSPAPGRVAKSEVTQSVTNGLVHQAQLSEQGDNRQLVLQLHPAELGQVTLQVDWENETLKAKIIASDLGTSELLNQNKQQMVQALAEEGLSFDSLDVAHDETSHQQEEAQDQESTVLFPFRRDSPNELEMETATSINRPSVNSTINIIV